MVKTAGSILAVFTLMHPLVIHELIPYPKHSMIQEAAALTQGYIIKKNKD